MKDTPPILTEDGSIRIHNQEGVRIPVFFEDEFGVPRDMTLTVIAFLTEHGFRRVLTNGLETNEKVLLLAPGDFSAHVDKMVEFLVRDESVVEMPSVWRGKIIVEGW